MATRSPRLIPRSLQHIREPLHLAQQIAIGQPPDLARLSLPQQRDLVPAPTQRMTIHAVMRQIHLAADKPLRILAFAIEHLRPRRKPIQLRRSLRPELLRLLDAVPIHRLILLQALYMGLRRKLRRRGKHPVLPQSRIQIPAIFQRRHHSPPSIYLIPKRYMRCANRSK